MMLLKPFFIVICTLLLTTSIFASQKSEPLATQSLEDGETLETSFSKLRIPCSISLPETASAFHAL